MYIIDDRIRQLVQEIENCSPQSAQLKAELVRALQVNCAKPEVQARYEAYRQTSHTAALDLPPMPLDDNGYLKGFDPLTQEAEFIQFWQTYGIVVSKSVVSAALCERVIARMQEVCLQLSEGKFSLDNSTDNDHAHLPVDATGVAIMTRGFFELYHDDAIAALRQALRVYLHHVLLWGRADLWTTFDRLGIKRPGQEGAEALPLHVDQNPNVHPHFRTVQGVLALRDCPAERGTFVGVPGSPRHFHAYGEMAKNQGEYVELDPNHPHYEALSQAAQLCPLAQGDLISWDSRTTHANSANLSNETRYVAYICAGPAAEDNQEAVAARAEALQTGIGKNVRDALMHASKPPRFTDPERLQAVRQVETLTFLGNLLYGKTRYDSL
ncbi:MAG: DUF1479 family protein [Candidatus Melainabacteria bacterium]|nr:DUF1479 family protein [Candidatus Melainabacteria bacterium]